MVECVLAAAIMYATVVLIRKLVKTRNHKNNFSSVSFVKISVNAKNVSRKDTKIRGFLIL
jgi:hypothetical protein